MRKVSLIALLSVSISAWLAALPALAALAPEISTRQIRDFTRLTFNWPEKVRFKVETLPQGVTLTFNQPAEIDRQAIRAGLGGSVTGMELSPDGTSITLRFDKPYRVRHFISGNANGIDLIGATKAATPPEPEPQAQAQAKPEAAQTASIPLPRDKPATPQAEAPKAEAPKAEALKAEEEKTEAEPEAPAETGEATDTAQATPEAQTEAETEPEPQADPAPAETVTAQAAAPTPPDTQSPPVGAGTPVAQEPGENATPQATPPQDTAAAAPEQEPAPAPEPTPEPTPEPAPEPESEPQPAPAEAVEAVGPAEPVETIETAEPIAEQPETQPETAKPAEPVEPVEPKDPMAEFVQGASPGEDGTGLSGEASLPQQVDIAGGEATAGGGAGRPFIVTTYSLATGTEIRFPWVQRVGAAVFTRGDAIYIVFSQPREINMALLKSILPAAVLDVQQLDVPGHTAFRLQTDGSVHAKVIRPKNTAQWWVTLSVYRQLPASPIAIEARPDGPADPHLYIPSLEYANPVEITDPLIGDELIVVPFFNPGEGVYPARSYPQVDILPSAQGMAMVKKSDFAEARPLRNGFRITDKGGLSLSADLPELALAELEALKSESLTWFPYDLWRVEPGGFYEAKRELEQQLLQAADVRANSLRLKLAQLYLGEGMANETLAWLQLIEANDPSFFAERKLMALRGAAHFLNDDYAAAKEAFAHKRLREHEEYKLWRDALHIFEQARPRFDYLDYFPTYISKYPPLMREKLGILAADNYINRKSFSRALNTLDTLSLTGIRPQAVPYVDFLLGKIAAENGNAKGAAQLWEKLLAETDNRFVRARAQFALTSMLYSNGEIDLKEAINRLDQLRIVWRGDSLELALLNYLGQLYMDDGDYLAGLRAWQELVQQFPETDLASAVAREMAKTFNRLYAEGEADSLPPLQALAIFYEFRQLTPVGEAGDVMIQALADRLIGVDLLDRAAALLKHQITFRQEKLARSRLGAKLALVHYLNKQPQQALDTLELTGYGRMPEALSLQRKRIAALAMAELGDAKRALDMLAPDGSREAEALRLAMYWKLREWPNVVATAESLLGSREDMTAPLSKAETEYLLQLSIAYMFERDKTQLQYLRNYFEPLIADGPNKEIFRFVTDVSGPLDPQRFEMLSQQIGRIESFMQSYRRRIEEGGLSPMVN